jgi:hypothetical protein
MCYTVYRLVKQGGEPVWPFGFSGRRFGGNKELRGLLRHGYCAFSFNQTVFNGLGIGAVGR